MYAAIAVAIIAAVIMYMQMMKKNPEDDVPQLTLSSEVKLGQSGELELDPEDRLLKELDAHTFEKDMSGMLTKDGFLAMRNLITAVTQEEFKPQKEELMQNRLKCFKENDW